MSKLIAVYTLSGLCLFGALFAVLAVAGIGRPALFAGPAPVVEEAAKSTEPPASAVFTPPTLENGRTYKISHNTPMYEKPDATAAATQTLPAGGYFTAVYTLTDTPGSWTQITVNDGSHDYAMYLLGSDLRWKVLSPVYSDDEERDQQMEATMKALAEIGEQRRAKRELEAEEEVVIEETPTLAEWWADRAERMGGATVANYVVAGVGAAVLTVVIMGAIVLLTVLRREHEWSRPTTPHDETIDLYAEEDDPLTYSKTGSAFPGQEQDDEDPRRA